MYKQKIGSFKKTNSNNNKYTFNTNEKIFNVQKYLYIVDSQVNDNLSSATCFLYKCS